MAELSNNSPYIDPCPHCGGYVEAITMVERLVLSLEHANIGDILQCTACECWGDVVIRCGERYADWGGKCRHCQSMGIIKILVELVSHPGVKSVVVER